MTGRVVDALAVCSRVVDRAICAAVERNQRQEAADRRARLEVARRVRLEGPGAARRPERVEWRYRWSVLRNRVARLLDRLFGR